VPFLIKTLQLLTGADALLPPRRFLVIGNARKEIKNFLKSVFMRVLGRRLQHTTSKVRKLLRKQILISLKTIIFSVSNFDKNTKHWRSWLKQKYEQATRKH